VNVHFYALNDFADQSTIPLVTEFRFYHFVSVLSRYLNRLVRITIKLAVVAILF